MKKIKYWLKVNKKLVEITENEAKNYKLIETRESYFFTDKIYEE